MNKYKMSCNNNSDDIFGSLKSIDPNNNFESIDKIGFANQLQNQFNHIDENQDSNELLDNSDILSLSKSSSFNKNEKQNQIKDFSNIQFSFSNISELDRKMVCNEAEEKDKEQDEKEDQQNEFNLKALSISTNSIKICNNIIKKPKEGNSFTPSTLCNYYQHSNEVTPIQNENKYNPINPVNIHQVNLNLIYNSMSNTEDSNLSKSASKKAASQLKYTKAQCINNNNNSNDGHIPVLPETKTNTFLITNNDNIEYINKGNKPTSQGIMNRYKNISICKPKNKVLLIEENVIQISLGKCANDNNAFTINTLDTINIITENNKTQKDETNVYFNGLRFGKEGDNNNPFCVSTIKAINTNNKCTVNKIKTKNNNGFITPKDIDKNINYIIGNIKTEATAFDSHTPKENELNTQYTPHIPSFSHSKKIKEIITDLINKSKSNSRTNSNSKLTAQKNSQNNLTRNLTLTSRNIKQENSFKKQLSNQSQKKPKKSLSNGKNNNRVKESFCKNIIKNINNKALGPNINEKLHNIRPISSLFNSNIHLNTKKTTNKNNNKDNKPHQKVNTQINLGSILSKFETQTKKRIEQSSLQSRYTFLNDTILNNNNKANDTFSKIILHTQETNITTETNTNPNINDHTHVNQISKYGANSSIASIKKIPKVIQNFSCYKKKNNFQSYFVSKEEIENGQPLKALPIAKCLKLKKLEGDDDFSITDE